MTRTALLLDRLDEHAAARPDGVAYTFLRDRAAPEVLTFAALRDRVDTLAAVVATAAARGDRVLLLYPPGLEFLCAFLACLRAGCIAVPAVPPPRSRANDRLRNIVADCAPVLVLATGAIAPTLDHATFGAARLIATDAVPTAPTDTRFAAPVPDAAAFLQYTSGSTGDPKGVVVTHGNIAANEAQIAEAWGHTAASVSVSWLPLFHDMGLLWGALQPLYVGFHGVLLAPASFLQDPACWLRAVSEYRAVSTGGPNFAFDHCSQKVTAEQKAGLDLSCLRVLHNGAEPIRADTLDRFERAFAGCGFRRRAWFPCYGLAESTLYVTGGPREVGPRTIDVDPAELEAGRVALVDAGAARGRRLVSSGCPAPGCEVFIVDPESGTRCDPDRVGEVWVRSPAVAAGYWQRPDESRAVFGNLLAGVPGTCLRTGDLGFVRDGELFVTGRRKDLIIVRGRNVYPQDIEAVVERELSLPGPNSCGAFAVDADDVERIGLVVEATRDMVREARADPRFAQEVADRINRAVFSELEVVVSGVLFVRPGDFPRTSSGKVQRGACRARFRDPAFAGVARWGQPARPDPSGPARATALIEWLRAYAARRLNSQLADERRCVPPHVVLDFGRAGLFGLEVSPAFGGLGLGATDALRVYEQLGAIDITLATMVGIHNSLGLRPVEHFAAPELRARVLPDLAAGRQLAAFAVTEPAAGSNPNALEATAVRGRDGWRLNGRKSWVGLGSWAGTITTFARAIDERGGILGTVALAVAEDTPGVAQGPEALTLGLRGVVQNAITFTDVLVPPECVLGAIGDGMAVAHDAFLHTRLMLAGVCLGAMKRCAQLMTRYATRRTVATGSLWDNVVTQDRVAGLTSAVAACGALTRAVARELDAGRRVDVEAYLVCKTAVPELLGEAADQLVQMLGGRGYIETNIAPRLFRDARITRIFEGPTEPLLMHLGSRVGNQPQSIRRVLEELFGAADVADELIELSRELLRPAGAEAQWVHYQLGLLATDAVLFASARRSRDPDAAAWGERRYHLRRDALRSAPDRRRVESDVLLGRVRDFARGIGDVTETLPGEDYAIDPLVAAVCEPAEPPRPPAPTPADPIGGVVLAWLRSGPDPAATAVPEHTPFTALGMGSLEMVTLTQQLASVVGTALAAETLSAYPTLAALRGFLAGRASAGNPVGLTACGAGPATAGTRPRPP